MNFDQRVQALRDRGVHVTWDSLRARGITPPRNRTGRFPDANGTVRRSDNGLPLDVKEDGDVGVDG